MRGSAARKMPITIIAMKLATAPIALPTALVRRPTEPSSWPPRSVGCPGGIRPIEATKAISRLNCWATTSRSASAWAPMVVPANHTTQPRNPNPRTIVSSSRHGRGIGSQRPSSRAPPSRNTAKIAPPMISSSGCARKMIPAIATAVPNQTAAFAISRRTSGSRNSAGPGRSMWGSVVGGRGRARPAISCSGATFRRGPSGMRRTRSAGSTTRSCR